MIQQDFNSLLQFIRESDPKYFNQMTLGKLIQELEKLPKDKLIEKIGKPHSYRGYYSDLAFERQEGTIAIGELLNELKNNCLNAEFQGYKGGEYKMTSDTVVWIATYGCCGEKIIDLQDNEIIAFVCEKDE